ncbi:hypothetical protein Lal_00046488 [Lupinus albus]|nr:hypothetical protein Lal_00046488 [Lupinus albus]
MLRLQRERMNGSFVPSVKEYFRYYGLDADKLALAKPDALVMHPGPMNRGVEISSEIADGAQSLIREQVEMGVAVRMAVLDALARHLPNGAGACPRVRPGAVSCRNLARDGSDTARPFMSTYTLADLARLVASRAGTDPSSSYTAKLLADGPAKAAKKLGEEAVEAAIAAVQGDREGLKNEAADVLYHLVVLLKAGNVELSAVMAELERRTAQSGLAEKASRPQA